MPNLVAYVALLAAPLVVVALFARLRVELALIWSLLLAYLFLPEYPAEFDFALIPPLDKHSLPAIAAFCALLYRHGLRSPFLPQSRVALMLCALFVVSPVATAATNGEPVIYGSTVLPALEVKDALTLVVQQIFLLLPMLMARRFLGDGGALRDLLKAFVIGALVYSLLMLVEIRLSPQLNKWIYGYYQHSFLQTMRFGGFRPMVFLYHGLWVAFFCMTAVVAAFALWRSGRGRGAAAWLLAGLYLTAILVLAKSLAALIYLVLLLPVVFLLGRKMQLRLALVLALAATSYPMLKAVDRTPEDALVTLAARISPDRAQSLAFRFDNETVLMDRALEKPLFGWGSWGRNFVFDPATGRNLTITDGQWILAIGRYGIVGYVAEFGLLLWPLVLLWWMGPMLRQDQMSEYIVPLALLHAVNMVDLLPNATLTPLTMLVAGALLGHAERCARLIPPDRVPAYQLRWRSII